MMRKRITIISLLAAFALCIIALVILYIKGYPYTDITPTDPDNYAIHISFPIAAIRNDSGKVVGYMNDFIIPQEHDVAPYPDNGYCRSWRLLDNYEDYISLVARALSFQDTDWEVVPEYMMLEEDIFEAHNVLVVKSLLTGSYRYYPQLTSCRVNRDQTSCRAKIFAYSPPMDVGEIVGAVIFLPVPKTVTEVTLEHETVSSDYEGRHYGSSEDWN